MVQLERQGGHERQGERLKTQWTTVGFILPELKKVYPIEWPSALVGYGQPVCVETLEATARGFLPFQSSTGELYFMHFVRPWEDHPLPEPPIPEWSVELEREPPYMLSTAGEALLPILGPRFAEKPALTLAVALSRMAQDLPKTGPLKTSERDASALSRVMRAAQRYELAARLSDEKAHALIEGHQRSLVYYLLLTCFDLLGQPDSFVPYSTWLESRHHKPQREGVLQFIPGGVDPLEASKQLHRAYLNHFGVKNSFNRFLHEVLPSQSLTDLLASLWLIETPLDGEGEPRDLSDKAKKEYLYNLRNRFTHRAEWQYGVTLPFPNMSTLLGPSGEPVSSHPIDEGRTFYFYEQAKEGSKMTTSSMLGWPGQLFEAVADGLMVMVVRALEEYDAILDNHFKKKEAEQG